VEMLRRADRSWCRPVPHLLTDDYFRQLGEWFRPLPEMTGLWRTAPTTHSIVDLEFLRFFPTLRRFVRRRHVGLLAALRGPATPAVRFCCWISGDRATRAKLDLAGLARFAS